MKKYLYFQPQYVAKFRCDGSKCNARCCKNWNIFIDTKTHKQYERIKPPSDAEEILSHMTFHEERKEYLVTFDDKKICPFLTEDNLCRLQRKYGENFLSVTCSSFPRRTLDFGKFFERSLVLTCPVAAEMILLTDEPIKFEFVEVPEKVHSNGGKIGISPVHATESFTEHMLEIQVAMISILQERKLTLDQRLIVLGFFLDRLDELFTKKDVTAVELEILLDALKKLIAAYESKTFLSEQVPHMLEVVNFNAKKFVGLMLELIESFYADKDSSDKAILDQIALTLDIVPDANGQVSAAKITENYNRLAAERKDFLTRRAMFLENYLVNELFLTCFPWKFTESIAKNFGVFVATYKLFELVTFSTEQQNFVGKKNLLLLTGWFLSSADHSDEFGKKLLELAPDDILVSIETLLEPR
ncbi:MAG: flagellin lysine-N-methylase [Selenomonadaceae bacterium]|nr:flagellin lysine-N-methylase [Selenomonadaceae bacterium]